MTIMNDIKICNFCNKLRKQTYSVYKVGFVTDNNHQYSIGMINLEKKMHKFLFDKGYHLSPTQIVLLRPDILQEFLSLHYNTKNEIVKSTSLQEAVLCKECFKQYKLEVPEK